MKKRIELLMAICLVISAFVLAKQGAVLVQSDQANDKPEKTGTGSKTCIVIDAGHGGNDPGKVGVNQALEKDINLTLALKLRDSLTDQGLEIILTRDTDAGLHTEGAANQKVSDMQNRCKIIADANPAFTVSLHQNSYTTSDVKGAQVFYYSQSAEGQKLASCIQESLIANVDPENKRAAKANDSYYLLKKTPTPTVIVECGFLSNPTEADLLLAEDYQDSLVDAISIGIMTYLEDSAP